MGATAERTGPGRAAAPLARALLGAAAFGALLGLGPSTPRAVAQAPAAPVVDVPRPADVSLSTGAYDADRVDWPVTAVTVATTRGDGTDLEVRLLGVGRRVLWTGRAPAAGPEVTLPVDGVWVREVTGVELSSSRVLAEVVRPEVDPGPRWGAGTTSVLAALLVVALLLLLLVAVRLLRSRPPTPRWSR